MKPDKLVKTQNIQLSEKDYYDFLLLRNTGAITHFSIAFILSLVTVFPLIVLIQQSIFEYSNAIAYILVSILTVFYTWISYQIKTRYIIPRNAHQLMKDDFRSQFAISFIITESDLIQTMNGETTLIDWSSVRKYGETGETFILFDSPEYPIIIPKRSLELQDIPVLRNMIIHKNIPRWTRKKKSLENIQASD